VRETRENSLSRFPVRAYTIMLICSATIPVITPTHMNIVWYCIREGLRQRGKRGGRERKEGGGRRRREKEEGEGGGRRRRGKEGEGEGGRGGGES
jgi:hypothetical protein